MGLWGRVKNRFRRLRRRRLTPYLLWITDDDNSPAIVVTNTPIPGQLEFASEVYSVLEAYQIVFIYVNRTTGDDGAVSVQYATADGTGVDGLDYTGVSGTLNWANGDSQPKLIPVVILLRPTAPGGDYTFTLTLTAPTGGATLVGSPEQTTVTIFRRSYGEAAFTPGQWYKQEVNPGPSNVSVLVQRNLAFKGAVSVAYHTTDGTAIAGLDYTSTSGTLNWADGDGSTKTILVPVLFRVGVQADRDFTITIDTPVGGITIGSPSTANVIISDAAVPANPTAGAQIPAMIVDDYYSFSADILVSDEEFYMNRNIQVAFGHGRSASRRFNGVFALDANTAWADGNLGYLTRTVNAGGAWTSEDTDVDTNLWDVFFASSTVGWAVGDYGVILKTTDSGDTWVAQSSGVSGALYSVFFTSTTVGWVVGETGVILKTTDGGTNWVAQTSGVTTTLTGVSMVSSTVGWIVGADGVILTTSNGTSWSSQTSGTIQDLDGVSAFNSTNVWAVGNQGTILFYNGTTWAAQTSGVLTNLNAVHFASATVGWAVGNNGTIRATTNGGGVWSTQTSPVNENLTSIWSVSTSVAYMTSNSRVIKTVNGGTNWTSSLTVDAVIGYGGYGAGGSTSNFGNGSGGGTDFLNNSESFSPTSLLRFQGHVT